VREEGAEGAHDQRGLVRASQQARILPVVHGLTFTCDKSVIGRRLLNTTVDECGLCESISPIVCDQYSSGPFSNVRFAACSLYF